MNNSEKTTDELIIAEVIRGDIDSYGQIMSRYEQKLLRYVIYLARDQINADDVVQDTFIKAYQNLKSFNNKFKFSSWIYRIAHNETMNAIKKENRNAHDLDFENIEEFSHESDVIKNIDKVILKREINFCLNSLSDKYREVLMLQYFENMKYVEIADILRIPVATVGVRCSRAKNQLKKICQERGVAYER